MFPNHEWLWYWEATFHSDGVSFKVESKCGFPTMNESYESMKATVEGGYLATQGVPEGSVAFDVTFTLRRLE